MPELPEVETVRRTLTPAVGLRVVDARVSGKPLRLGKQVTRRGLLTATADRSLSGVRRRGKYLLLDLTGDHNVLVHLGMSGRLRLCQQSQPPAPHTHVVLVLAGRRAEVELRYSDPRRFGFVEVIGKASEDLHPSLAKLGPDPLEDPLTGDYLHATARGSRRTVKAFLLDQRVVAGIGNIYASEALWLARIRPTLAVCALSRPRAAALAEAVGAVLRHALSHGGTTLRDFVAADGSLGEHSGYLRVYGKDGAPCPRGCGGQIKRSVVQGRSTFHCPTCQRR